jgi:uncharacterized protein (PEP-CTERM system associated)
MFLPRAASPRAAPEEEGQQEKPFAGRPWKITPSVSAFGSYTSNVRLAPPGQEQSDFFTTISPSLNVTANTSRLTLNLDYSLDAIAYARAHDLDELRNRLALVSTITVAPEVLFLDARASVQQYPQFTNAPVSGSPLATSSNLVTVTAYSISPYFRHHFGTFADSELRYTFNQVTAPSQPDALTNQIGAKLVSGSQFTRLLWTVLADGANTNYVGTNGHESSTRLGVANAEYRLDRAVGLLASVGYERISDPTLVETVDGPIGSVGVRWTPGPRTSVVLNLTHRFDETFVSGEAHYLFGPRTRIDASYTEQLETSQTLFGSSLNFLTVDEFGNFIDSRTAQLFSLGDSNFGLQTDAFLLKRFNVGLRGVRGRNSFGAILYDENRDIQLTGESDHAIGGAISWGRLITPLAALNLTLRYRDATFDFSPGNNEHQQIVGVGTSLVYQMNESLDGIAAFNFTRQFDSVPENEFQEGVFSVGLQKRF